jgi:translation initiation factor 3 subunit M
VLREKEFERRIEDWGITHKQKRQLYKSIRDLLKDVNSMQSHQWGIKYLQAFEGASEEEINAALDDAVQIITEAVKHPDILQFDNFLAFSVVKKLENHPKHGAVFQILRVFVNETLDSFTTFTTKNPDFLKSVGLSTEDCLRKMRLLSLATLASGQQEIPYSLIAKTLQVNESDVEFWVISAISENLISAKMDQMKRTVFITRSLQRVFGKTEWKQLSDSLQFWRNNIKSVLENIKQAKQQPSNQHGAFVKAIQQQS